MLGFDRLRDVQGNVPLPVAVWLEHDPTAVSATALALAGTWIRWHYRLAAGVEVVLKGPRLEVMDSRSNERLGTARIHGFRSAGDFDALPVITEQGPFLLPSLQYPSQFGFACDIQGEVGRFRAATHKTPPGLLPKLSSYDAQDESLSVLIHRLGENHTRAAWSAVAFAVRVRDLLSALLSAQPGGNTHISCAFEGDRLIAWPQNNSDEIPLLLSALHGTRRCLGCSRYDPRDRLARGTWCYSPGRGLELESYQRSDEPDVPLPIDQAAHLLGRSVAELAATRLPVQFASALRVDPGRVQRAM